MAIPWTSTSGQYWSTPRVKRGSIELMEDPLSEAKNAHQAIFSPTSGTGKSMQGLLMRLEDDKAYLLAHGESS